MSANEKIEALRDGISAALIRYCDMHNHLQVPFSATEVKRDRIDYGFSQNVNLSTCESVEFVSGKDNKSGFKIVLKVNGTHYLTYHSDSVSLMSAVIIGMTLP